jgi:hypothetical protein
MAYAVICLTTSPCQNPTQPNPITIVRTKRLAPNHVRRSGLDSRSYPSCVSGCLRPKRNRSDYQQTHHALVCDHPDPCQSLPKSLEYRLALDSLLNAPAVTEPTPMITATPFPNPPPAPRSALDPGAFPSACVGVWREMRIPTSERRVAIAWRRVYL